MLTKEEVLKIAKLARLEISEEEVSFYQNRLTRVLDYMEELKSVQTVQDALVKHVPREAEPFRKDEVRPFFNRKAILENAPALEEGGFLLPAIMESE
jgi:aspartyl-tRNA(Asn)/glutamyl-tRNA(Gln) amidotransferase subunit C